MSHYDTFMSFYGTNDTYASKSIIVKMLCQYTMTRCEKLAREGDSQTRRGRTVEDIVS
jgi:hypothetical protein